MADHAIVEFPIPTPGSNPWDVAVASGPDVWFTEFNANKVGRYHVPTGTFTELELPTPDSQPAGITADPYGVIWLVEANGNNLARIDPATLDILEVPIPTPDSRPLAIAVGPDGNLWFTEAFASQVGRLELSSTSITEFPTPTPNATPMGIAGGPASVWFTESHPGAAAIVQIVLATMGMAEVKLPDPDSSPLAITLGPDGNMWFTAPGTTGLGSGLGKVSPVSLAVTMLSTPTPKSAVAGIAAGPDHNVWFTEGIGNLGFVNPDTLAITEIPAGAGRSPFLLTTGFDGTLWFTDPATNSLGEVFVRVAPGPCGPGGCPAPTEIACIVVDKVFDYCYQQDTSPMVCAPLLEDPPPGPVVSCTVSAVSCTFASSVPAASTDYVNATFVLSATVTFSVQFDAICYVAQEPVSLFKTVTLCGPTGTTPSCAVVSATCIPPVVIDEEVCTTVTFCATFASTAQVQLLVPAYGYCTPAPCVTLPLGACPPSPIFPPQCT